MKPSDRGPIVVRPPGSTVPIPVGRDTNLAQKAENCLETVANDEVPSTLETNVEDIGKTYLEMAIIKLARAAMVDADARKEFLDRSMGKPKQRVDSTTVTVNLTDYLQQLVEEEHEEVIDAELTPSDDPEAESGLSLLC